MHIYTETERISLGKDRPLVLVNLCLPRMDEEKTPLFKGFTAYYRALRTGFLQFAEEKLQKKAALETPDDFKPYGAVLSSVIAFDGDGVASVYVDASVTAEGKRRVHRLSQLWRKDTGTLVKNALTKGGARGIIPLLNAAAEEYAEKNGTPLYSDWEERLKKCFRKEQFYLSPKGIVFYYQAGDLSAAKKPLPLHLSAEEAAPFINPDLTRLVVTETKDS